MREIGVYDLLVFETIGSAKLSYRALFDAVNKLIASRAMPSDYVTTPSAKSAVENALRRLHAAQLIDAPRPDASIDRDKARELLGYIGANWRRWPYFIPIRDEGGLDYDNAKERN